MSDYISVQEAVEKVNKRAREMFSLLPGFEYYLGALHDVAFDLKNMPTVDAVPVVRCKDCKYRKHLPDVEGLMFCQYVIGAEFVRNEDDYCSRGERKDV